MTEKQVGFLYKVASVLSPVTNTNAHTHLLRSYYLMRCKEITKGYGLPRQQFSNKNRCSFCCLEWTRQSGAKIVANKISKRQRKRIRQKKHHKDVLHCKKIEQICSFCKHHNELTMVKPNNEIKKDIKQNIVNVPEKSAVNILDTSESSKPAKKLNKKQHIYSNAREVFSLSNEKNTIPKTIPIQQKIIKNNKRKKDKFAGLCKQAVLAASQLKEKKEEPKSKQELHKIDKLSLFLRPTAI